MQELVCHIRGVDINYILEVPGLRWSMESGGHVTVVRSTEEGPP